MKYDIYSRTNRRVLDGVIVGASFCLAYLVRYEGHFPANLQHQMWVLLFPVAVGQLLTNFLLGVERIQWRYVSIPDAGRTAGAYLAFSSALLALRFGLPEPWHLLRVPTSVIAIEFLLSTQGALAIRLTRRFLYERQSRRSEPQRSKRPTRLVLVGAGMMGSAAAKELASRPGIELVGFLDDDPGKIGCLVAGVPVLGPTSLLPELARAGKIDDAPVCISPTARPSFARLHALLENLPIPAKFVPTINEILEGKDGIQATAGESSRCRTSRVSTMPAARCPSSCLGSSELAFGLFGAANFPIVLFSLCGT